MENELDNIASDLTPSDTQTVETPTENKAAEPVVTENPAQPVRASKYDTMKKSYDELRSFTDRKNNEYVSKIKAMEDRMKTYQPYEEYLPQLKAVLEQKRLQDQQQQYQQNPLQAQQQAMEQMLNERLAPFQQQQAQQQNESTVNESINFMKTTYGDEAFKEVSPYMANILENTRQNHGDEVADILARNPEHLFQTAFGQLALNKIKEFNSQRQAGTQNKANLAQQSAGVARPNRVVKASPTTGNGAIEQAAYSFLEQNS